MPSFYVEAGESKLTSLWLSSSETSLQAQAFEIHSIAEAEEEAQIAR